MLCVSSLPGSLLLWSSFETRPVCGFKYISLWKLLSFVLGDEQVGTSPYMELQHYPWMPITPNHPTPTELPFPVSGLHQGLWTKKKQNLTQPDLCVVIPGYRGSIEGAEPRAVGYGCSQPGRGEAGPVQRGWTMLKRLVWIQHPLDLYCASHWELLGLNGPSDTLDRAVSKASAIQWSWSLHTTQEKLLKLFLLIQLCSGSCLFWICIYICGGKGVLVSIESLQALTKTVRTILQIQ